MPFKSSLLIAGAVAASLSLAACEDAADQADYDAAPAAKVEMPTEAATPPAEPMMEEAAVETGTIVAVAAGNDALSTLVAAVTAADLLVQAITDNGGTFTVTTVNGADLNASIVDGNVILTDATGGTATVTATDIDASNGVVHLIDTVVMPG